MRRDKKEKYTYSGTIVRNYTYALMLVIIMFVSWLDFCLGGIVTRYVTDVMPLAYMLSAWCLLQVYEFAKKIPELDKKVLIGIAVTVGFTIVMGYSQVLWQPDGETNLYHPEWISILEELICFWN